MQSSFLTGDLIVWEDGMLLAGRRWNEAINDKIENSAAAVILVSPFLLYSQYVTETEIPAFLQLAEDRGIYVFCLFLDHSVADRLEFSITVDGTTTPVKLTDYQGLNPFSTSLVDIPKRQYNKILSNAAKTIHGLVGIERPSKRRFQGFVNRDPVIGRKTLSVTVERKVKHPVYGKVITKSKKYAIHWNEKAEISKGDHVEFAECAPVSKTKRHALIRKIDK